MTVPKSNCCNIPAFEHVCGEAVAPVALLLPLNSCLFGGAAVRAVKMAPGSSERTDWQELSGISGLTLLLLPSRQFWLHNSPLDFKVQYSTYRSRLCNDVPFWVRTLEEPCGIRDLQDFPSQPFPCNGCRKTPGIRRRLLRCMRIRRQQTSLLSSSCMHWLKNDCV